jgi:hypothetical protein
MMIGVTQATPALSMAPETIPAHRSRKQGVAAPVGLRTSASADRFEGKCDA